MRRLQQIIAQLPIADRAAFEANAFPDYADVAAVNLLSTVLKSAELLNGLADDFKLYSQGSMRYMDHSMGYDPSELMFMGDDDGSGMMMRGHHP